MRIGIDVFGGDDAPLAVIKGLKEALPHTKANMVLYGDENKIVRLLTEQNISLERLEIKHCDEVITGHDRPVKAIKKKKNSSMVSGLMDLRKDKIDSFVSAGNTGALLAGSLLKVGRIKGIDRPSLVTPYPTESGVKVLADAGANSNCKPINLEQFSIMGQLYAELVLGISNPKVALVNIGEEKGKGTNLVKDTYELLENKDMINFAGNIEARDIPKGKADVIICDGFTGNVILKLSEGIAMSMTLMVKEAFLKNILTKMVSLLVKSGMKKMKKKLDYSEYGGAPLLGVKKLVVKAHGSSNSKAFKNAFIYTEKSLDNDIVGEIKKRL